MVEEVNTQSALECNKQLQWAADEAKCLQKIQNEMKTDMNNTMPGDMVQIVEQDLQMQTMYPQN